MTKCDDGRRCTLTDEYVACRDTCLVEGEEVCLETIDGICQKKIVSFYGADMPMCNDTTGLIATGNELEAICNDGDKYFQCNVTGEQKPTCLFQNCTLNFICKCTDETYDDFCKSKNQTFFLLP